MNEKHFTLYSLFLLKAGDCTPFLHSVTLHSKNLIINAMKHLALKLALGATLLLIIGVDSTTATLNFRQGHTLTAWHAPHLPTALRRRRKYLSLRRSKRNLKRRRKRKRRRKQIKNKTELASGKKDVGTVHRPKGSKWDIAFFWNHLVAQQL